MAIGTVGEEIWKSVRLLWHRELWLPVGLPIAGGAYGVWLGVTGTAVTYLADRLAGPLTVSPWTSGTDFVVATLAILWILGPAAVVALIVRNRMTDVRGNLATPYRLRHPSLLLAPPVGLLTTGVLGLVWLGRVPPGLLVVLLAGSIWFVVRTVAYSYRVFALSIPGLGHVIAFLSAALWAVGGVTLGARIVRPEARVDALATELARQTGLEVVSTVPNGTAQFDGVVVPVLVLAVVGLPVLIGAGYVGLQVLAGLAMRLRKPSVKRPELRTGQRYPSFARPTASVSSGAQAPGTTTAETQSRTATDPPSPEPTADAQADEADVATDDETDLAGPEVHVSHTRVYHPPDDADVGAPATVAGWTAKLPRCQVCGATYDPDADAKCPDCGADLRS
jgi:hypothetical protein